jgi:CDGSH-type Zn-finger protein
MMDYPKVAHPEPICVHLEKDKVYAWCTCGLSEKDPFCDGKHKSIVNQEFKSMKVSVEESQSAWLCRCKQTKTPPYCDGSHRTISY